MTAAKDAASLLEYDLTEVSKASLLSRLFKFTLIRSFIAEGCRSMLNNDYHHLNSSVCLAVVVLKVTLTLSKGPVWHL